MKWIKKWDVPKSTDEGTWRVALSEDGKYGCSCPVWKFKRQECHHIKLIKANPDMPSNGVPKLPEIIPGNVEETKLIDGVVLHPLIPIPDNGLLATIVYDLLKMGYSFSHIKKRFHMIPHQWTMKAVMAHVEHYGRIVIKQGKHRFEKDNYVRIGAQ